jgi:hypothetical protein
MIGWGLGRADHPWSAAVEQGCLTLPRDMVASPTRPYLDKRKRCRENVRTVFQRWQKGDGSVSAGHDD